MAKIKSYRNIVRRKGIKRKVVARSSKIDWAQYKRLKSEMLRRHPQCAVYPNRKAVDVHHVAGRAKKLLMWTDGWLMVSRAGHIWIHNNLEAARAKGWLCPRGFWNNQKIVT